MSFVRTLATLAAGFAAAKGVEQYKKMGGMAGLKETLGNQDALSGMTDQVDQMMAKIGIPGAGQQLKGLMVSGGGFGFNLSQDLSNFFQFTFAAGIRC